MRGFATGAVAVTGGAVRKELFSATGRTERRTPRRTFSSRSRKAIRSVDILFVEPRHGTGIGS